MTTLRIGIADYDDMKARTLKIARGELRPGPDDPKVWFTSMDSLARILSPSNRELLGTIAEHAPGSLDELSRLTGRAKSNLSRTLKRMAGYGLVDMVRDKRGRLVATLAHDRIALELPLARRGSSRAPHDISVGEG